MLAQPLSHEMSDLVRAKLARLNGVCTPGRLEGGDANPALPTHLRPGILGNDFRPMLVVHHMVAHPVGECQMVTNEARIISTFEQAVGLGLFSGIEQANMETIQTVRRRRGPDLPWRNRIAAQQEVLSVTLRVESAPNCPLHHSMPPFDLPFRSATKHTQFRD